MQEYWVNVYKYPKLKAYCYSHDILNKQDAIGYSEYRCRKCLYRIHVKMKKPEIKVTVIDNCGKSHTYEKWRVCRACAAPKPFDNIFKHDNWRE